MLLLFESAGALPNFDELLPNTPIQFLPFSSAPSSKVAFPTLYNTLIIPGISPRYCSFKG